jgi:multidrug transporter EmrE-like cation transporter
MIGSAYLLLIVAILFGVIGQLLLKYAMARRPGFQLRDLRALAADLPLIGGFLSYGISTLLYFKVLANLDLSLAYPTVSLSYVMITLLSRKLFQEKVSPVRWAAILIICAGVALVGLGVK